MHFDESYCSDVGEYLGRRSKYYDETINAYINILRSIRTISVTDGELACALDEFTECADKLNGVMSNVAELIKTHIRSFLAQIEDIDRLQDYVGISL